MSLTHSFPRLAQPGIFRGFTLATPDGFVPQGEQAEIVQFIQSNASPATTHEVRLVLEGRMAVQELSPGALVEMRRLTVQYFQNA